MLAVVDIQPQQRTDGSESVILSSDHTRCETERTASSEHSRQLVLTKTYATGQHSMGCRAKPRGFTGRLDSNVHTGQKSRVRGITKAPVTRKQGERLQGDQHGP